MSKKSAVNIHLVKQGNSAISFPSILPLTFLKPPVNFNPISPNFTLQGNKQTIFPSLKQDTKSLSFPESDTKNSSSIFNLTALCPCEDKTNYATIALNRISKNQFQVSSSVTQDGTSFFSLFFDIQTDPSLFPSFNNCLDPCPFRYRFIYQGCPNTTSVTETVTLPDEIANKVNATVYIALRVRIYLGTDCSFNSGRYSFLSFANGQQPTSCQQCTNNQCNDFAPRFLPIII